MSDFEIACAALATACGALVARDVPLAVVGVVGAFGLWSLRGARVRRGVGALCVCAACALGVSQFSHVANIGLHRDIVPQTGTFAVSLLSDPTTLSFGGASANARVGNMHVRVESNDLNKLHAGQSVRVSGRLVGLPLSERLERRNTHQVAVLKVASVDSTPTEPVWYRAANAIRGRIQRGARALPADMRALFNGIVLGDDREQPLAMGSFFRRSGLSHVTAVSGQNVAFVMTVFQPLLHRLRLRRRWIATAVIIAIFAIMVRFEPSVLRATAMVAVSVTATTFGRPLSSLRALSLVAIGLLCVDPLLVYSLGFQLSLAACFGLAVLAKPIARILVGPTWLRDALSVTIAAQLGTAPFLFKLSGGVPVASLLTNLVALPLASFVMMWGLVGGVLAGFAPSWLAGLIHTPSLVVLETINAIATFGARMPLGRFGTLHVALLSALAVLAVCFGSSRRHVDERRDRSRFRRMRIGCAAVLMSPTIAVLGLGLPNIRDTSLDGLRVDRTSSLTTVVVFKSLTPNRVVRTLERLGVYRVDELVVTKNSSTFASVAVEVRNCFGPTHVVAPPGQYLNFAWVTHVQS